MSAPPNPFQYILYVRPEYAPDQRAINMVPSNAKIVIQNVHKLPKPFPAFLDGTPLLAEPRRQNIWRGSELFLKLDDYNEFIRFHPLSLMMLSKPPTNAPTPQVIQFPITEHPDTAPPPPQPQLPPPQYAPSPQPPQYAPSPQPPQYAPSPQPPQYAAAQPQPQPAPPQYAGEQQQQIPQLPTVGMPIKRKEPMVISAPQPVDDGVAPLSPIGRLEDPNPLPPPVITPPVVLPRKRAQYPIRRNTSAPSS